MEIYEGSIDCSNEILKNSDAILAIEVIEHLYPDVLNNFPYNIFGYITPKIAIFTTPNCEFNVMFDGLLSNGMRHLDHKFEWTRAQFKDWCQNICQRYSNYVVNIFGIGNGPSTSKKYGCVSQMAVFIRKDMLCTNIDCHHELLNLNINKDIVFESNTIFNLIHSIEYPFHRDERTLYEKIFDEAIYQINVCRNREMYNTFVNNVEKCIIPLSHIFGFTKQYSNSIEELQSILIENKYEIESNNIITDVIEQFYEDDMIEPLYGVSDNENYHYYENEDSEDEQSIKNNDESINENVDKNVKKILNDENISDNISECWD